MASVVNTWDVSIDRQKGYVGAGFRDNEAKARAIFAMRVGQRTNVEVVALICNGVEVETKHGERKPSANKK